MQKQTESGLLLRGPLCTFHINKSVIVPILFVGFYPFHAIIFSLFIWLFTSTVTLKVITEVHVM